MSCSRKNCENIMCDTYVDGVGYVCYKCQEEFKKYLRFSNLNPSNDSDIRNYLEYFIQTKKGIYSGSYDDEIIDSFFNKHTLNN